MTAIEADSSEIVDPRYEWTQDASYNWYATDIDGSQVSASRIFCEEGERWVVLWTSAPSARPYCSSKLYLSAEEAKERTKAFGLINIDPDEYERLSQPTKAEGAAKDEPDIWAVAWALHSTVFVADDWKHLSGAERHAYERAARAVISTIAPQVRRSTFKDIAAYHDDRADSLQVRNQESGASHDRLIEIEVLRACANELRSLSRGRGQLVGQFLAAQAEGGSDA